LVRFATSRVVFVLVTRYPRTRPAPLAHQLHSPSHPGPTHSWSVNYSLVSFFSRNPCVVCADTPARWYAHRPPTPTCDPIPPPVRAPDPTRGYVGAVTTSISSGAGPWRASPLRSHLAFSPVPLFSFLLWRDAACLSPPPHPHPHPSCESYHRRASTVHPATAVILSPTTSRSSLHIIRPILRAYTFQLVFRLIPSSHCPGSLVHRNAWLCPLRGLAHPTAVSCVPAVHLSVILVSTWSPSHRISLRTISNSTVTTLTPTRARRILCVGGVVACRAGSVACRAGISRSLYPRFGDSFMTTLFGNRA